jgi:hypothetical protein
MPYRVNLKVEVEDEVFFVLGDVQFAPRIGGPDLIIDYVGSEDSAFLEYVREKEWIEQISRRCIIASVAVPEWQKGPIDVEALKKGFVAAGFALVDNSGNPLKGHALNAKRSSQLKK